MSLSRRCTRAARWRSAQRHRRNCANKRRSISAPVNPLHIRLKIVSGRHIVINFYRQPATIPPKTDRGPLKQRCGSLGFRSHGVAKIVPRQLSHPATDHNRGKTHGGALARLHNHTGRHRDSVNAVVNRKKNKK